VQGFESYRTVSQINYRDVGPDHLAPLPVTNPNSVWTSKLYGTFVPTPIENEDVQFRRLTPHVGDNTIVNDIVNIPGLSIVGRFDPGKLPGFSALSRVPLEARRAAVCRPRSAYRVTDARQAARRAEARRPYLRRIGDGASRRVPALVFCSPGSLPSLCLEG
jgi:hypothetical protein